MKLKVIDGAHGFFKIAPIFDVIAPTLDISFFFINNAKDDT